MPLDTATVVQTESVAARIGLVPVPAEVLKAHMKKVKADYLAAPQNAWWLHHPDNAWRLKTVCWKTLTGKQAHSGWNANLLTVANELAGDYGAVPRAVRAIAKDAQQRAVAHGIQDAELVAGYFYTDPYVCLRYRENGKRHDVCLAIWEGRKVLNIAKLT